MNERGLKGTKIMCINGMLLCAWLYGRESQIGQEKHKSKPNATSLGYLTRACGKTRSNWVKNEWVVNEWGFNTKMSNQHERSMLGWSGHRERMNEDQIAKPIFEGRMS